MSEFYLRTENIKPDELERLIVRSRIEDEILKQLISRNNLVIEGSRGTGKSFLMKYSARKLENEFDNYRILPVYVTFMASTLIHTSDPFQFRNWMVARALRELIKCCLKKGLVVSNYVSTLLNADESSKNEISTLDSIVRAYEGSYKNPGNYVNSSLLPELNDIIDALNELCTSNNLNGIYFFFDEAAHIFRPEQQRQFFTLFRDLRSPYVTSKAAVYPGVTHYGDTFEAIHDAAFIKIERGITDPEYLWLMNEIVFKQIDESKARMISANKELFNTVIFLSNGNPRVLLKITDKLQKISTSDVDNLIRKFFRNDIWSEHTSLGEKFKGHKVLVDWGRKFIEDTVIPSLVAKNFAEDDVIKGETSIYFWIHKDSPVQVFESLNLLSYTGVIRKIDEGVKGTRSLIGVRYEVNYGVFLSQVKNPTRNSRDIISKLQINNFSEYGRNHSAYNDLSIEKIIDEDDVTIVESINRILDSSISEVDLSNWQKRKLINDAKILTIRELIDTSEDELIRMLTQVGVVRARQMKNAAYAEVLEYISG